MAKVEEMVFAETMGVEIVNEIPENDLNHIVNLFKEGKLDVLDFLGQGAYGEVYGYKDYAIKSIFEYSEYGCNDIAVLKDISHLDCIPTLYAIIDEDTIIVERVKGYTVRSYVDIVGNPFGINHDIIEQWECALLDILNLGYSPYDLHTSNVMINEDGDLKIVDVGHFRKHHQSDVHIEYKSNKGYSHAQALAGNTLKRYVSKLNFVGAGVAV